MIILPFSSDQFNIAYDAEKHGLAEILDPNGFKDVDLFKALQQTIESSHQQLNQWSAQSQKRGPDYAVEALLNLM